MLFQFLANSEHWHSSSACNFCAQTIAADLRLQRSGFALNHNLSRPARSSLSNAFARREVRAFFLDSIDPAEDAIF